VKKPGLTALQGREVSDAVDPLDLGWTAVAVRAGVGLVYSVLIKDAVTPRSVGGSKAIYIDLYIKHYNRSSAT